jgi:GT2 family glycosyltransferase
MRNPTADSVNESLPLVSVVMVNYNGRKFVIKCLKSVLSTRYPTFETIIVDNDSSDGSYELLVKTLEGKANVRIIRNETNVGYAAACNVGFRASTGEVVVFLNVDVAVDREWLTQVVEALYSSEPVAAVQPQLLSEEGGTVDSVGGFLDRMGYVYLYGQWYASRPSARSPEPFYVEGAALAAKRQALSEVVLNDGPFDPAYFYFYEDTDLCWRLRLRGFQVRYVAEARAYHYRGYVTGRIPHQATYYFLRNRISTLIKNYGLGNLALWMSTLLLLEITHATISLAHQPWNAISKFRAMAWSLANLKSLVAKRALVQSRIRRVDDSAITRFMSPPNIHALTARLMPMRIDAHGS